MSFFKFTLVSHERYKTKLEDHIHKTHPYKVPEIKHKTHDVPGKLSVNT